MTFGSNSRYIYFFRYCSLLMYTFSVKPQGCNVFSFSLRYCLVIMCCNCRSKNDVKKKQTLAFFKFAWDVCLEGRFKATVY